MSPASIVAIDGPAGSGKSTLGRALARRLGYLYFDTGVLYRAVTLLALRAGLDAHDESALVALAQRVRIDVTRPTVDDGRLYTVTADGEDITWQTREPAVDANVSAVSAHAGLRRALLPAQRAIARRGKVVMVGRDVGTVVAPQAEVKVFLDASLEVRAQRRCQELCQRGHAVGILEVREEMRRRDEHDSTRATAPLSVAPDAVVIRTDSLSVEEEVEMVEQLVRQAEGGI